MTEEEAQRCIRELAHGLWQSGGTARLASTGGLDDWLIAEQMVCELRAISGERFGKGEGAFADSAD
jgi:hypothetical protein